MWAPLATLTTRPCGDWRTRGRSRLVSRKGPMWLVAYVKSKPSGLRARVPAMPALLTSTSIGWLDARNSWAARRTEARSETSRDTRSEERRVGKECRSRWARKRERKKRENIYGIRETLR